MVANNIALIFYSLLMSNLIDDPLKKMLERNHLHSNFSLMVLSTAISAIIILIFGEFLPKAIFRINPNGLLEFFAVPFLLVYWLLSPVALVFAEFAKWILKVLVGLKFEEKDKVFERSDLEHFVKQTQPQEEHRQEINTNLFENALYLKQVKVRECMVPRMEMEVIDVNDSMEHLKKKFVQTKLSRLVVVDDEVDNVVGYVHHQDLLKSPLNMRSVIKQIPPVPESMLAIDLMNLLMKNHKSMAWVVDEFGGTAGLVTLEDDAVEELVEKQLSEDEFIFSGRIEIDYINEKYQLNIPHGDYETLAGYIVANHENIPEQDEKINVDNFEIDILMVSETRIETVKMKVLEIN